ncbi:hypothetical protein DPMN_021388 [Dreissena polymorpha]|uniref:Uncharacterized protein n=1 Tax=Dreissena polymorpha TaxID=45954 RepID=A0A9D4NM29_DREPO|nr:hypothetical protein DPMN_021388 [Dreissena polymorpha]
MQQFLSDVWMVINHALHEDEENHNTREAIGAGRAVSSTATQATISKDAVWTLGMLGEDS